jgi:hypothetical protein
MSLAMCTLPKHLWRLTRLHGIHELTRNRMGSEKTVGLPGFA